MTAATTETTRLTSDPVPRDELRADVTRLFEAMAAGGIGIVPLDVAYAVIATTPSGIRRIFEVEAALLRQAVRHVRQLADEPRDPSPGRAPACHGARARRARADPVLGRGAVPRRPSAVRRGRSVRAAELVEGRHARHAASTPASSTTRSPKARSRAAVAVFGSSANLSLTGSKYRYEDIDRRSAMPPPSISTMANRNTRTRMGSRARSSTFRFLRDPRRPLLRPAEERVRDAVRRHLRT